MTASISVPARVAGRVPADRLAGFGPLFRKELREWTHSKRIWVILAATTAFMALTAANGASPPGSSPTSPTPRRRTARSSLDPLVNFFSAISTQIFVIVAIFAAMSLLIGERDTGHPLVGRIEARVACLDLVVQVGRRLDRPVHRRRDHPDGGDLRPGDRALRLRSASTPSSS